MIAIHNFVIQPDLKSTIIIKFYLFPAIEVHACQFVVVRLSKENIEGLALVNKGSSVSSHIYESLL